MILQSFVCGALGVPGKHAAGAAGERIGDKLGEFLLDGATRAFDRAGVSIEKYSN